MTAYHDRRLDVLREPHDRTVCWTHKAHFATEAEVERWCSAHNRVSPPGRRMRHYRCPVCAGWHVTKARAGRHGKRRR